MQIPVTRISTFSKSVGVLASGSLFAQFLLLCTAPIITRIYEPGLLGRAAVFNAIMGILAPAICGKYEIAVVTTPSSQEAKTAFTLATRTALFISLAFLPVTFLCSDFIASLLNNSGLADGLFLLPLALFSFGANTVAFQYAIRFGGLKSAAVSRAVYAIVFVTSSICLGLLGQSNGLIIAIPIAWFASFVSLLTAHSDLRKHFLDPLQTKHYNLALDYKRLPQFNASTAMVDGLTCALPALAISIFYNSAAVGFYAIITRVTLGPLSALGTTLGTMNQHTIAEKIRVGLPANLHFQRLLTGLAVVGALIVTGAILFGPVLFEIVFGPEWRIAGSYLRILAPGIAIRFIGSTLSTTFGATGNDRLAACWKISAFILTVTVLFFIPLGPDNISIFIRIAALDVVLYSAYLALAWYCVRPKKTLKDNVQAQRFAA